MRACKFTFYESPVWDGWTDDTYWNGFLNVCVTSETRDKIVAWFRSEYPDDVDTEQGNKAMLTMEPGRHGLIDLGYGYATQEYDAIGYLAGIGRDRS